MEISSGLYSSFDRQSCVKPINKVLIVDDEIFDQKRAKRTVRELNSDAVFLCSEYFFEGFDLLCSDVSFSFAMIDNNLPDGNTVDLIHAFYETYAKIFPPLIMVSGDADPSLSGRALKRGFSAFISKDDLTPSSLQEALSCLTQGQHQFRACTSS